MYNFANILFSGKCNAVCHFCVGKIVNSELKTDNLNLFPLKNLDKFVKTLNMYDIKQISLTATDTDPLLYKHQEIKKKYY